MYVCDSLTLLIRCRGPLRATDGLAVGRPAVWCDKGADRSAASFTACPRPETNPSPDLARCRRWRAAGPPRTLTARARQRHGGRLLVPPGPGRRAAARRAACSCRSGAPCAGWRGTGSHAHQGRPCGAAAALEAAGCLCCCGHLPSPGRQARERCCWRGAGSGGRGDPGRAHDRDRR